MDLITGLMQVKRLSDFVESGNLAGAMADAGIQAGVDALKTLPEVNDKRAQVWSAVNHLQYAEAAVHTAIATNTRAKKLLRPLALAALVDRQEYLLCLLAACYRYLGERALFEQTLSQALSARKILNQNEAVIVLFMVNPASYVDMFRGSPCRVNVGLFGTRIRELPGPDSSVAMKDDPVCVCSHRQTNHRPTSSGETSCRAVHDPGDLLDTLPASSVGDDGRVFCECPRFSPAP